MKHLSHPDLVRAQERVLTPEPSLGPLSRDDPGKQPGKQPRSAVVYHTAQDRVVDHAVTSRSGTGRQRVVSLSPPGASGYKGPGPVPGPRLACRISSAGGSPARGVGMRALVRRTAGRGVRGVGARRPCQRGGGAVWRKMSAALSACECTHTCTCNVRVKRCTSAYPNHGAARDFHSKAQLNRMRAESFFANLSVH